MRNILIATAGAVTLVAVSTGIYSSREPRYQGRALSEWIDEEINLQFEAGGDSQSYEADPKWRASTNAVYQIGTEAVPWLISWANASDSKIHACVIAWVDDHPWLHWHIRTAAERRDESMIGLILLGDKAPMEVRADKAKGGQN